MSKSENSTFNYVVIGCFAAIFGAILGATYQQQVISGINGQGFPSISLSSNEKLDKILKVVRNNYVDSLNIDSLENLAIDNILEGLDPHSIYLPPIQAKGQNESLEGNFDGIGIEYYILNDTLFVTNVRDDGPSFKAGLKKGDKIIEVDGELLISNDLMTDNVVSKLRGRRGSKVKVSVIRKGLQRQMQFEIVRDRIVVSSIDAAYLMNNNLGFIKISKFGANTSEDFISALSKLKNEGMKTLILDLRGNGGGYLNAATELADQFLPDNKLIVYTQGLHEPRTDYKATSDGLFEEGKLFVLIDEGTASASEIVAGAMQDLDRATLIGRRSFGKGLVQEQFGFGDGSAMNLTIARYYTPSGRSIQKSYSKGREAYREELNKRFERGEYTSLDSAMVDSVFSINFKEFKTTNGRKVYSGGGIMPDVFVPLDTTGFSYFYTSVRRAGIIPDFVYGKLINSVKIAKYKNAKDFDYNFKFSDEEFQQFLNYCIAHKINIENKEVTLSKPIIINEMKSLLARYYFEEEGYYRVSNNTDDCIQKVLEEIKKQS